MDQVSHRGTENKLFWLGTTACVFWATHLFSRKLEDRFERQLPLPSFWIHFFIVAQIWGIQQLIARYQKIKANKNFDLNDQEVAKGLLKLKTEIGDWSKCESQKNLEALEESIAKAVFYLALAAAGGSFLVLMRTLISQMQAPETVPKVVQLDNFEQIIFAQLAFVGTIGIVIGCLETVSIEDSKEFRKDFFRDPNLLHIRVARGLMGYRAIMRTRLLQKNIELWFDQVQELKALDQQQNNLGSWETTSIQLQGFQGMAFEQIRNALFQNDIDQWGKKLRIICQERQALQKNAGLWSQRRKVISKPFLWHEKQNDLEFSQTTIRDLEQFFAWHYWHWFQDLSHVSFNQRAQRLQETPDDPALWSKLKKIISKQFQQYEKQIQLLKVERSLWSLQNEGLHGLYKNSKLLQKQGSNLNLWHKVFAQLQNLQEVPIQHLQEIVQLQAALSDLLTQERMTQVAIKRLFIQAWNILSEWRREQLINLQNAFQILDKGKQPSQERLRGVYRPLENLQEVPFQNHEKFLQLREELRELLKEEDIATQNAIKELFIKAWNVSHLHDFQKSCRRFKEEPIKLWEEFGRQLENLQEIHVQSHQKFVQLQKELNRTLQRDPVTPKVIKLLFLHVWINPKWDQQNVALGDLYNKLQWLQEEPDDSVLWKEVFEQLQLLQEFPTQQSDHAQEKFERLQLRSKALEKINQQIQRVQANSDNFSLHALIFEQFERFKLDNQHQLLQRQILRACCNQITTGDQYGVERLLYLTAEPFKDFQHAKKWKGFEPQINNLMSEIDQMIYKSKKRTAQLEECLKMIDHDQLNVLKYRSQPA